jgi:Protein of unknown function (DUF992)
MKPRRCRPRLLTKDEARRIALQVAKLPELLGRSRLNLLDTGFTAGGLMAWAVVAPTAGPPRGGLAGVYVGAGAYANVLGTEQSGSGRVGHVWSNVEPMSQRIDRSGCKRLAANLGLLAYATVFCLSVAGDGLAFEHSAPAAGRLAAARPFAPNLGRNARPAAHRPFPGETGFTGVPPHGETQFVSNEIVLHAPSHVSAQAVDAAARRLGLVAVSSQNLALSGGTLFRFRIDNGRQVSDVVRELEAENIGVAQPNYIYRLQ